MKWAGNLFMFYQWIAVILQGIATVDTLDEKRSQKTRKKNPNGVSKWKLYLNRSFHLVFAVTLASYGWFVMAALTSIEVLLAEIMIHKLFKEENNQ